MSQLALAAPDELVAAAVLSRQTDIPRHSLSKIMRTLVAAKLALAAKGPGGDFQLAKNSLNGLAQGALAISADMIRASWQMLTKDERSVASDLLANRLSKHTVITQIAVQTSTPAVSINLERVQRVENDAMGEHTRLENRSMTIRAAPGSKVLVKRGVSELIRRRDYLRGIRFSMRRYRARVHTHCCCRRRRVREARG